MTDPHTANYQAWNAKHLASIFYETTQSWLPFQTTKTRNNANTMGF